jgi:hypothetical protein
VCVLGWVLVLGLVLLRILGGVLCVLGRMLEQMWVCVQRAEHALLGATRLALRQTQACLSGGWVGLKVLYGVSIWVWVWCSPYSAVFGVL